MQFPIKVIDIELTRPIQSFEDLDGYMGLQALIRLRGVPLGYVKAPITLGCCSAETLGKLILEKYSWEIVAQLLKNGLASPERSENWSLETLINLPKAEEVEDWPLVTVAVCTRDRPDDMRLCLAAIDQLDYPALEVLVVDNAPTTEATKTLIEQQYPHMHYVREPRPGLDWARNRAILEAKGEIIAFTDDDVVVDAGWVKAIARTFADSPDIMAVTGLVVPYELETQAQVLFEDYGGFGRGFKPIRYQVQPGQPMPWYWLGAGQFGTGANMAYRRSVFEKIGYFDPALDVGTPTNGGGDLEMFLRVLRAEYALVYEPQAMIRHRHRREYAQLKRQISYNGSTYALWMSIAGAYPQQRWNCLKVGVWWMLYWNIRRLIITTLHRTQFPKDLVIAEVQGAFASFTTYRRATQRAAEIEQQYGPQTEHSLPIRDQPAAKTVQIERPVAVRQVELSRPLQPLSDLENYGRVRIFMSWQNSLLGSLDYDNHHHSVSVSTLSRLIVDRLGSKLLNPTGQSLDEQVWSKAVTLIKHNFGLVDRVQPVALPDEIPVSVVVATFDRPDDLRNCLRHLQAQQTCRRVEIVVVDNHPASGLTRPVVQEFENIVLVEETRQGLAYARNAGFVASTGDILIATDDDVTVPPDWLEKLVQPFTRPEVMVVTGNVLPIELETPYQQAFENYGGLGRGFDRWEVDGHWYDLFPHKPSPTWLLGATANAAFRATIFNHPQIGLMDECLGPGMPSGVGEDTYLFYKAIKAGYTIIYEPKAFVWHKHRRTAAALKRQLYGYSKGHVSYNLTTWLRDGDWRGLAQVLLGLPYGYLYRIKEILLKRSDYPLSLIWLEIRGNLAGPWSLWRSRRRVRKEGFSEPYQPPHEREHRIPTAPNAISAGSELPTSEAVVSSGQLS